MNTAPLFRSLSASSTLCVLFGLFCLCCGCLPCRATDNATSEGANFWPDALSFSSTDEFTQTILSLQVPLVVVVFNDEDEAERKHIWAPLVKELCLSLHDFLIKVGYLTSHSEVGQNVQDAYNFKAPAMLLFEGFLTVSPSNSSLLGKFPKFYREELDYKKILRWILKSISADFITRLEHENDFLDWFGKMPKYPKLPRVLYFTGQPYVGPVYRILSQSMHSDAVFGVVVDALGGDPNKKALAQRYNISQKSELPVLLVLHRRDGASSGVEDEVHFLQSVTARSTVQGITNALLEDLPEASANVVPKSLEEGDSSVIQELWEKRVYILGEIEKERQEILSCIEKEASGPLASYNPPVEVRSQAEWEENCIRLPKGHQCLVTFSESAAMKKVVPILKGAAKKIAGSVDAKIAQKVHFVVADVVISKEAMNFFGIAPDSLPSVVLLVDEAQIYFNFDGSFSEDSLVDFYQSKLKAQNTSDGKSLSLQKVPPLSAPKEKPFVESPEDNQEGDEKDL